MQLKKILLGVRFGTRIFRISNLAGIAIDELLLLKKRKKYVKEDDFLEIGSNMEQNVYGLFSKKTGREVKFLMDDIVISEEIADSNNAIHEEEFKNFCYTVLESGFKSLRINDFKRLGVIHEYELSLPSSDKRTIDKAIKENFINFDLSGEPENCTVRFSIKDLAPEAGVIPDNSDYYNTIIQIRKANSVWDADQKIISLAVDTQKYYANSQQDSNLESELKRHFTYAGGYIENKIFGVLKNKGLVDNEQ